MKLPGSTRSSTFSRVVRCPVLRRRATASGRAASRPWAWRATTSARSGRIASRSTGELAAASADAASIGYSASHGCIRMLVEEAEWLFERVPEGTPVFILDA